MATLLRQRSARCWSLPRVGAPARTLLHEGGQSSLGKSASSCATDLFTWPGQRAATRNQRTLSLRHSSRRHWLRRPGVSVGVRLSHSTVVELAAIPGTVFHEVWSTDTIPRWSTTAPTQHLVRCGCRLRLVGRASVSWTSHLTPKNSSQRVQPDAGRFTKLAM
jgi:hypothetical protein